jgi:hypothetical protein
MKGGVSTLRLRNKMNKEDREIRKKALQAELEALKAEEKLVSLYPCSNCGGWCIVEQGNYHPWCLRCMLDEFDWNEGYTDITRGEAERIRSNSKDTPMNKEDREIRKKALQAELEALKSEEKKEEDERREKHAAFCLENIDSLLAIVPQHSRTSCNDQNCCNHDRCRCSRCFLLDAKECNYWDQDYEIELTIRRTQNNG